jgi:transposase
VLAAATFLPRPPGYRARCALRAEHLGQPAVVTAAYAATTGAATAVLTVLNEQIKALQGQVDAYFGQHPDTEIILSQPGLGPVLGAQVLAEFSDDHDRYADAKCRKNYAGTSPITRASGKRKGRAGPVRAQRPIDRCADDPSVLRPTVRRAGFGIPVFPDVRIVYLHQVIDQTRGPGVVTYSGAAVKRWEAAVVWAL